MMWTGFLAQEQVEGSCGFGDEPSSSIKCWETMECSNNGGSLEWCLDL
jgi:hypothetical protein